MSVQNETVENITTEQATQADSAAVTTGDSVHVYNYDLSPGKYDAEITDVNHSVHPTENYSIIKVYFVITKGRYQGWRGSKVYHLGRPTSIRFIHTEFARLGVVVTSPDDLIEKLRSLIGMKVLLDVVTSAGSTAKYFHKPKVEAKKPKPLDLEEVWADIRKNLSSQS